MHIRNLRFFAQFSLSVAICKGENSLPDGYIGSLKVTNEILGWS
jgi:hypothetical protein